MIALASIEWNHLFYGETRWVRRRAKREEYSFDSVRLVARWSDDDGDLVGTLYLCDGALWLRWATLGIFGPDDELLQIDEIDDPRFPLELYAWYEPSETLRDLLRAVRSYVEQLQQVADAQLEQVADAQLLLWRS